MPSHNPRILCTGIAVLDEVFRVDEFPAPDGKAMASEFVTVGGGCAANAAVAIARLGGEASFAGPLGGPAGQEPISDRIVAGLARERVGTKGCVRLDGAASALSAIFVNKRGERTIATYRDHRLDAVTPPDADALVAGVDAVLADNRFPAFSLPICRAARRRRLPVVLDADKPAQPSDPLFAASSLAHATNAFLAVTDGPNPVLWRDEAGAIRELPVFKITAVDTLAAGDIFHAAFALALVEGRDPLEAMRFGAAAAAVKCTRFGGSASAPTRAEVDAFMQHAR